MKRAGKVAMFIAISILMLHTILPHQHHDQIPDDRHAFEHEQADSLLDYILLAFHANPGENHLEEFEKASSATFIFLAAELGSFEFQYINAEKDQPVWVEYETTLIPQFFYKQISFRGPPQLT